MNEPVLQYSLVTAQFYNMNCNKSSSMKLKLTPSPKEQKPLRIFQYILQLKYSKPKPEMQFTDREIEPNKQA